MGAIDSRWLKTHVGQWRNFALSIHNNIRYIIIKISLFEQNWAFVMRLIGRVEIPLSSVQVSPEESSECDSLINEKKKKTKHFRRNLFLPSQNRVMTHMMFFSQR